MLSLKLIDMQVSKHDHITVRTKSQYYTASDCQTTSGHTFRRSARGRDRRLRRERLWEKESFRTTMENATGKINKRSRRRVWQWRRASWWWRIELIRNIQSSNSVTESIQDVEWPCRHFTFTTTRRGPCCHRQLTDAQPSKLTHYTMKNLLSAQIHNTHHTMANAVLRVKEKIMGNKTTFKQTRCLSNALRFKHVFTWLFETQGRQ